ncbi:MAG TPA: hypothetical protein VMU90_12125 [Solirubrobacteraceae bacterium]|nr:hypothetical protein [Solirubrobacteraceae bacterium]
MLPLDETPAQMGRALHAVLMELQLRVSQATRLGRPLSAAQAVALLPTLVGHQLHRHQLDVRWPAVQARPRQARPGLELAGHRSCAQQAHWVLRTGTSGRAASDAEERQLCQLPLGPAFSAVGRGRVTQSPSGGPCAALWVEPALDHGPGVPAVQLGQGLVCPTRPDVIGPRRNAHDPDGPARVVIIDYKLRRQVIHPAFDPGCWCGRCGPSPSWPSRAAAGSWPAGILMWTAPWSTWRC